MSLIVILVIAAAAVALALALAYLPMRLLLQHMANNVKELIQRTRERRKTDRATPDRRKAADPASVAAATPDADAAAAAQQVRQP